MGPFFILFYFLLLFFFCAVINHTEWRELRDVVSPIHKPY